MERRNNVDMYFARLVFRTPLHETAFSAKKYKQIDKETNRSEKTFINDDWRLRNDLPYKAVKPTWIKLQNHLSKLNVTHTRAANILRHSGEKWREQRYILWQSIINFHYELCWSEKLMGKPFFFLPEKVSSFAKKSTFKQVWLFSTSWCPTLEGMKQTHNFFLRREIPSTCFRTCNNENNSQRINSL